MNTPLGIDLPESDLGFEHAMLHLKSGVRVRRAGWNGKGMWIAISVGGTVHAKMFWSQHARDFAATQINGCAEVLPYIIMKTADNKILMGWLASQSDMLASDWEVVR